jgi:hypothetical protein
MDSETKKLLIETLELSRENNKVLKKLERAHKWSQFYRMFYWGLIILSLFGSYFFLQPYLQSLLGFYNGGQSSTKGLVDVLKDLDVNKLQQELKELNQ